MAEATDPTFTSATPATVVLAALAGSAGSWAALVGVTLAAFGADLAGGLLRVDVVLSVLLLAALSALTVLLVWTVGMVLIGYPVWFLAHRAGLRSLRSAVATGALTAGAGCIGLGLQFYVPAEPGALATLFGLGAAGGACAGATIWFEAYRRGAPA